MICFVYIDGNRAMCCALCSVRCAQKHCRLIICGKCIEMKWKEIKTLIAQLIGKKTV